MKPTLTTQQKFLFERLSQSRRRGADLLEQPYMKGVQSSVVEKYSDQAHFIYELLQNADDVKATTVRFILNPEGVIFAHNGKIHFSLTDPATEHEDSQQHQLGHLNSITSIGNSSKYAAQIGKFGIGFKAVFQYVDTPEIYDPPFFFKIERFIVPLLLAKDHPQRRPGETLFYFPFDHRKQPATQSFQDIFDKLKSLIQPLLFLQNLTEITWQVHNLGEGQYTKQVTAANLHKIAGAPAILVETVNLKNTWQHQSTTQNLLVFSRPFVSSDMAATTHFVNIAYLLNATGQIHAHQEFPAYCFFPTEKTTKLRFIIQAPFLLTDSREGIRNGVEWNKQLIDYIAKLTADSLPILKSLGLLTEDFFQVLPVNDSDFPTDSLFRPIYHTVLQKLQSASEEALLPSVGDSFVNQSQAYLADPPSLMELFGHSQLGLLFNQPEAQWIFPSLPTHSPLWQYAKNHLTANHSTVTPAVVIRLLNRSVMQPQSDAWVVQFYRYWLEHHRAWWNDKSKKDSLRSKPIIRLANDQMVAPYDALGTVQVYLPTGQDSEYPTVKSSLVKDEKAWQFLVELGLKKPTDYEELKYYILPRYHETAGAIYHAVMLRDFRKLLVYFLDSPWRQREELLNPLKSLAFCRARHWKVNKTCRVAPQHVYFYTPELSIYFSQYQNVYFLETEFYAPFYQEFGQESVESFFKAVGVTNKPRLLKVEAQLTQAQRREIHQGKCTRDYANNQRCSYDFELEGLPEVLAQMSPARSKILWQFLLALITEAVGVDIFRGQYRWFYRKENYHQFEAKFVKLLKTTAWLYDENHRCVKPSEVIVTELAKEYYDLDSYAAKVLLGKLNIPEHRLTGFTVEQKHKYAFGEELFKLATVMGQEPSEVLKRFQAFLIMQPVGKKSAALSVKVQTDTIASSDSIGRGEMRTDTIALSDSIGKSSPSDAIAASDSIGQPLDPTHNLAKKRASLEEKKARLEQQLGTLTQVSAWQQRLDQSEKYTLGWFKALLELEQLLSYDNSSRVKDFSITFAKVAVDATAKRILILTDPSRFLPLYLEEVGELSLQLHWPQETKKFLVEVVSVKELTLRARFNSAEDWHELDWATVHSASLEIKPPGLMLESLKTAFRRWPYPDDYNLKTHLPSTIEFIFGPPGTGKTTYLAKHQILPLMTAPEQRKILVLTPTNKAADVLFRKILEEAEELDDEPPKWLIRFGLTGDSEIERAGFLKDKSFDITRLNHCTVVTTLARFIYDGFRGSVSSRLKNYDWNVIIIDEASMIMLANLVYVLYQQPLCRFMIAGDPMQIPPIVTAPQWQEENIYTLVGLTTMSLSPPSPPLPQNFPVTVLTTQYRSIPPIGQLVSHFSYQGILSHYRPLRSKKPLRIKKLHLSAITVIKFPVNKFESIYKAQRLEGGSAYHIYSAIFTVELALYLAKNLLEQRQSVWRIGIICPYIAQASLVEKMLATQWPVNATLPIITGTIHSFQGDDCDIILNLLNPPPSVGTEIFLNQPNILNVSISRAKDYLILIVPDITGLTQLERLQALLTRPEILPHCQWFTTTEMEQVIFNSGSYIYDNSSVTTHQKVNVYCQPAKKYEVRCEDNVIDLQWLVR